MSKNNQNLIIATPKGCDPQIRDTFYRLAECAQQNNDRRVIQAMVGLFDWDPSKPQKPSFDKNKLDEFINAVFASQHEDIRQLCFEFQQAMEKYTEANEANMGNN
jgi:hypothetical protein